jgi:calcium channel MID1
MVVQCEVEAWFSNNSTSPPRLVRSSPAQLLACWYTNTTPDSTCQVIFDLDFCDSVAYAVPTNSTYQDKDNELKALYDDKAAAYFTNFSRSLAQFACNTEAEAQYSLARTCKDCERDYKSWLCSILIPRCEDWNATGPFLQERNVNMPLPDGSLTFGGNTSAEMNTTKRNRLGFNSTRNPGIDAITVQAPYKEMMPCEDLCFDIVRSCPAKLGFACPNSPAKELTYGRRDPNDVELRCNFPGAVVKLNVQGAAGTLSAQVCAVVVVAITAIVSSFL